MASRGAGAIGVVSSVVLIVATTSGPMSLAAQTTVSDTAVKLTLGAFVDGYYAWDFGRPPTLDRSFAGGTPFTTQPSRHNEFNVNLAFVEAKLEGQRVRGRLALQTGTSVQSNYAGEAKNGFISGPSPARNIQEAYAGIKAGKDLWVDGGIFFSHFGTEAWISRDNLTYTRSLIADYSPYYSAGVRAVWRATPALTAHLHVVNGWQNISENNSGKGAGIRLDFNPTAAASISYFNFFSDEAGNRLRTFHGAGAKVTSGAATLLGEFDVGNQSHSTATRETASWYGFTAIAREQISPAVALVGRVERYDDEHQVIIATGQHGTTANGPFRGNGVSGGVDVQPQPRVLWRTEIRGFMNKDAIFPDGPSTPKKSSGFIVTSLAVTF